MERKQKKKSIKEKQQDFIKQLKIAYANLEDSKKFYRSILLPLILIGLVVFCAPFIVDFILPEPLGLSPLTFAIGGIIPIFLGILYPYITWKNKENDINSKMHFFITHLRVLAISDLSLKDIVNMLGDKSVYASLGKEIKKISILSTQWRYPMAKTLHFIAQRTPSKIFKDFLDRFSQSLDSGVEHREFIETEQEAVIQEYKTMYETSNENIVILNEVYVSMLIAIIFVMSFGIVLPMILGAESMTTYTYLSSFLLIVAESMLLYLLKAMIPQDDIWHKAGEKGEIEIKLMNMFRSSLLGCGIIGAFFFIAGYYLSLSIINLIPFEILTAIVLTPLAFVGVKVFFEEQDILRKEKNFLGFLPALGSISTMKGSKINESVYYLSRKDYGILTKHIRNLYRRLRTRIDDDAAWQWFGVDTGSNFIQRSSEMFREATFAAANPRKVSRMISENMRKILDLRVKKHSIVNTSISLFAGITFGISFAIYISIVISRHLNNIIIETGDPFSGLENINMGTLLFTVPPETYEFILLIIFAVLVLHCFLLAYTLKSIRGSHKYIAFLYFVPFVWIVAITSFAVQIFISGMLG
ncbi:MAG: type II secretion system F family protein [Candidatus Thermoplasmatota archaeon]|nr:type II secretion system F family protein [Candidatus Thermoplasmatota archaeon]